LEENFESLGKNRRVPKTVIHKLKELYVDTEGKNKKYNGFCDIICKLIYF
jgi:hypothetical protein